MLIEKCQLGNSKIDDDAALDVHLPKVDDSLGPGRWVHFHNGQRGSNSQATVENVDTDDNRVTFTECSNDLQATWPYG